MQIWFVNISHHFSSFVYLQKNEKFEQQQKGSERRH